MIFYLVNFLYLLVGAQTWNPFDSFHIPKFIIVWCYILRFWIILFQHFKLWKTDLIKLTKTWREWANHAQTCRWFLIPSWNGFNDGHHYKIHFIQARLSASKTVTSELMRKTTEVQSRSKTLQLQVGFKNTATLLYKLMCYNWKTCHNISCERWFVRQKGGSSIWGYSK